MSKQQLLYLIEQKRVELVEIAMKHGFSSYNAITCSQELDRLLNKYHEKIKKAEGRWS
ncbi:Spo0E family sporulation regulatory protein-aspartic acid phosphatase [Niallia sp. 01092]|uniref:Spo0E family sporulation regulatory protein-aspartic acid phosphatase n=1 Tax=unclassified Niallia TaxID=2837522 RepID=UPI003FD6783B